MAAAASISASSSGNELRRIRTAGSVRPASTQPAMFRIARFASVRAAVEKLNRTVAQILDSKDVVERLQAQGAEPMRGAPEAFAAFMREEMAKWAPVVKTANIKAE